MPNDGDMHHNRWDGLLGISAVSSDSRIWLPKWCRLRDGCLIVGMSGYLRSRTQTPCDGLQVLFCFFPLDGCRFPFLFLIAYIGLFLFFLPALFSRDRSELVPFLISCFLCVDLRRDVETSSVVISERGDFLFRHRSPLSKPRDSGLGN
jgi:hypothetical protein